MQTGGLLKDLTVAETVRLTATLFPHARPVGEVLDRAGIADIGDRLVGKCSGGQQQRLRFALALLSDPLLMVLDEPTAGMDVEGRRDFWSAIREDAIARPYRPVRDALPRRSGRVRGPDRADPSGTHRRRRHHRRDQGDGQRPDRPRDAAPASNRVALASLPGVEDVELRGDTVLVRAKDSDARGPIPAERDRPRATWRSPRTTSKTRSSR